MPVNARKHSVFKALAKRHSSPAKVQKLLSKLTYNREKKGETVHSAYKTFRRKRAHCLEGCVLTAAILEQHGYPPLILSLDSKDDLCHAIFVFKEKTGWGAVAKSRDYGLQGRAPKFRSIRDLAWSYFEPFVDKTGKLVGYALLNLDESGTDWRYSDRNLWKLEQFVVTSKHQKIRSSKKRYLSVLKRYLKNGDAKTGKHWW